MPQLFDVIFSDLRSSKKSLNRILTLGMIFSVAPTIMPVIPSLPQTSIKSALLVFINSPLPLVSDLPLLAVLGIICTALSHSLFIKALANMKAQTVSIITGLEPVWGIMLALLFLSEIPDLKTIIGGGIIIFTSFLTTGGKN